MRFLIDTPSYNLFCSQEQWYKWRYKHSRWRPYPTTKSVRRKGTVDNGRWAIKRRQAIIQVDAIARNYATFAQVMASTLSVAGNNCTVQSGVRRSGGMEECIFYSFSTRGIRFRRIGNLFAHRQRYTYEDASNSISWISKYSDFLNWNISIFEMIYGVFTIAHQSYHPRGR